MFVDLRDTRLEKPSILNAIVAPRPIAWVSSMGADGSINLAPFSYFNLLTNSPPTAIFSCVKSTDRPEKDTLANIRETGGFVINLVSRDLLDVMHATSRPFPRGTNEFERLGIEPAASRHVPAPRVRLAPAAFECRALHFLPIEPEQAGDAGCTAVIARIIGLHVADQFIDPAGRFLTTDAQLMARMGGNFYCSLGEITELVSVAHSG